MTTTLATPAVTDALTPEQARRGILEAQAQKREAEQLAAALEERVRSGHADITPEQLASARESARFAELRITAAERRLAAAIEADLHARAAAQAARAREIAAEDTVELVAAFDTATQAIHDLVRIAGERCERIREVWFALRDVEEEMAAAGMPGMAKARHGVASNVGVLHLEGEPHPITATRPAVLIAAAAYAGAGLDGGHGYLAELHSELAAGQANVRRALAELPELVPHWQLTRVQWDALDYAGCEAANQQGRKPQGAIWPPQHTDH
ncbi:hypothetical protein ACEZDB_26895 [Streptacidiphilus sp. N1-3]|uniref:DUF222 domain-containing protein n=1 Tax=Streptacidiphilus alkalitolerans TaxID=3342712 RepID=A0ABV6X8H6_9ACTN